MAPSIVEVPVASSSSSMATREQEQEQREKDRKRALKVMKAKKKLQNFRASRALSSSPSSTTPLPITLSLSHPLTPTKPSSSSHSRRPSSTASHTPRSSIHIIKSSTGSPRRKGSRRSLKLSLSTGPGEGAGATRGEVERDLERERIELPGELREALLEGLEEVIVNQGRVPPPRLAPFPSPNPIRPIPTLSSLILTSSTSQPSSAASSHSPSSNPSPSLGVPAPKPRHARKTSSTSGGSSSLKNGVGHARNISRDAGAAGGSPGHSRGSSSVSSLLGLGLGQIGGNAGGVGGMRNELPSASSFSFSWTANPEPFSSSSSQPISGSVLDIPEAQPSPPVLDFGGLGVGLSEDPMIGDQEDDAIQSFSFPRRSTGATEKYFTTTESQNTTPTKRLEGLASPFDFSISSSSSSAVTPGFQFGQSAAAGALSVPELNLVPSTPVTERGQLFASPPRGEGEREKFVGFSFGRRESGESVDGKGLGLGSTEEEEEKKEEEKPVEDDPSPKTPSKEFSTTLKSFSFSPSPSRSSPPAVAANRKKHSHTRSGSVSSAMAFLPPSAGPSRLSTNLSASLQAWSFEGGSPVSSGQNSPIGEERMRALESLEGRRSGGLEAAWGAGQGMGGEGKRGSWGRQRKRREEVKEVVIPDMGSDDEDEQTSPGLTTPSLISSASSPSRTSFPTSPSRNLFPSSPSRLSFDGTSRRDSFGRLVPDAPAFSSPGGGELFGTGVTSTVSIPTNLGTLREEDEDEEILSPVRDVHEISSFQITTPPPALSSGSKPASSGFRQLRLLSTSTMGSSGSISSMLISPPVGTRKRSDSNDRTSAVSIPTSASSESLSLASPTKASRGTKRPTGGVGRRSSISYKPPGLSFGGVAKRMSMEVTPSPVAEEPFKEDIETPSPNVRAPGLGWTQGRKPFSFGGSSSRASMSLRSANTASIDSQVRAGRPLHISIPSESLGSIVLQDDMTPATPGSAAVDADVIAALKARLAAVEGEKEAMKEDIDGWRLRCQGLEAKLEKERRDGLELRERVRRLGDHLSALSTITSPTPSSNFPSPTLQLAPQDSHSTMLSTMRDQLFALAAAVESEKRAKSQAETDLAALRAELTLERESKVSHPRVTSVISSSAPDSSTLSAFSDADLPYGSYADNEQSYVSDSSFWGGEAQLAAFDKMETIPEPISSTSSATFRFGGEPESEDDGHLFNPFSVAEDSTAQYGQPFAIPTGPGPAPSDDGKHRLRAFAFPTGPVAKSPMSPSSTHTRGNSFFGLPPADIEPHLEASATPAMELPPFSFPI